MTKHTRNMKFKKDNLQNINAKVRGAVIQCATGTGFKPCQQTQPDVLLTEHKALWSARTCSVWALLVASDMQPIQQLKIKAFILMFRIIETCYQYPCRNHFSHKPILPFDERILLKELILLNPRSTLLKCIHISKMEGNTDPLCYLHMNCFISFQYTMKYS